MSTKPKTPTAQEAVIMRGLSDDANGLGRFRHHPDPAIDFCIEVETLESRLHQAENGLCKPADTPETVAEVLADIKRAMEFIVGGDEGAVRAKGILRGLEKRATTPTAQEAVPVSEIVERKFYHSEWKLTDLLAARHGGLVTDQGEAWSYRYSHKDGTGGKYDLLFRREPVAHPPQPSVSVAEAAMTEWLRGQGIGSGLTIHPDDLAVDRFAAAMKSKLAKKRAEGRGGWERKDECSAEYLTCMLVQHIWKGDPLDVGNLAMMLHQRGERIVLDGEAKSIALRALKGGEANG